MNPTLAASETAHLSVAPWPIDEEAFPIDGDDESKLAWLLHRTILAPSELPPEDWSFRLENETLELYADRCRRSVIRISWRASGSASCGPRWRRRSSGHPQMILQMR